MPGTTSRTFRSGNSQAMRLPKEVAFEDDTELRLFRSGDLLTALPKRRLSNAQLAEILLDLPGPSDIEERDADVVPDRPGL